MLKTLITLMRAQSHAAEQDFTDRHAIQILGQQIRDAAADLERAKRALALAIAGDQAEATRLARIDEQVTDLEERTVAALAAGREDLAREAAEALAGLEADRTAINEARGSMAGEIARMRSHVADATRRLAELERGRRVAEAGEAVRRLRGRAWFQPQSGAALAEAEATLRRLKERQAEAVVAEAAMASMEGDASKSIAERMEAEGFGRRTRPSAADILERLKSRAAATAPAV